MRNLLFLIFFVSFLITSCGKKDESPIIQILNSGWKFKKVSDTTWLTAEVPGSVYTDLMTHKIIPDPFKKSNELDVQWVSETSWEYALDFDLSDTFLKREQLTISFDGLDTYATVFLNDSLLFKGVNSFRKHMVDIKPLVKHKNRLRVIFNPTSIKENEAKEKNPYELPEGERVYTRKAQYQYGWDWGPKLNDIGIWKDVYVTASSAISLDDVYVKQGFLKDTIARLDLGFSVQSKTEKELFLDVFVNDTINTTEGIVLNKNSQNFTTSFWIDDPKLWWTHNLGDPYLYDLKFVLRDENTIYDVREFKRGIRTIELIAKEDEHGQSFYFELNGMPVFMKGANYIPQHSFPSQVKDADYNKLLNDVVAGNMNMLRVWGGGIYEKELFYQLCDEKGILVWQDFMFACAMYPGDANFLNNVKDEALQQVKRLRNHTSLALWCGNNESSEGWHRWGWQAGRDQNEVAAIWKDYTNVFQELLPEIVAANSETSYWESSPKYGRGNPQYEYEGDAHDWWVWHDAYPFEHFEDHVPRFMSEFGFQSYPSFEAIKYFTEKDSVDIKDPSFETHQKHSRGEALIAEYMRRDYPVPKDDKAYVYVSQLLQAKGITMGIEAHRRAMPYTMGSLYWQLNDCWPVVSWSSIDFLGNWKALHYKAKVSFENLLISNTIKDNVLQTYIVNDGAYEKGDLKLQIIDFDGKVLWEHSKKDILVSGNASSLKHEMLLSELDFDLGNAVLISEFNNAIDYYYFKRPKDLQLKDSGLKIETVKTTDGYEITLKSKTLYKDVFLYAETEGFFEENYFDVLPNKEKKVFYKTSSLEELNINYLSLNQMSLHF